MNKRDCLLCAERRAWDPHADPGPGLFNLCLCAHCCSPLKTVYRELEAAGALGVLSDERMMLATGDIKTEGRGRPEIERDIKQKENAVTFLARTYQNAQIDETAMRACILSIADNHTYLLQNRHSCDTMLQWLQQCFGGGKEPVSAAHSLAILGGRNGARLTHSHASQYAYVMQSLMLWREIIHDFFRLWVHTEEDLFDANNPYRLRNTGQGLNRVQSAPRVGKAMHNILHHCQSKVSQHRTAGEMMRMGRRQSELADQRAASRFCLFFNTRAGIKTNCFTWQLILLLRHAHVVCVLIRLLFSLCRSALFSPLFSSATGSAALWSTSATTTFPTPSPSSTNTRRFPASSTRSC